MLSYKNSGREVQIMQLNVNSVIYFYMFICVALLVYNIIYIFSSKRKSKTRARNTRRWELLLAGTWKDLERTGQLPEDHIPLLEKKLKNVNQLIAYHGAIEPHLTEESVHRYLDLCHDAFQFLAVSYRRRPAMERAFFAYVIAAYHPSRDREHDQLVELLLDFMQDSTIYCRENVLKALCALGHPAALEHAFQLLSDLEFYHHPRLLSDGLMKFTGDKTALAWRLWKQRSRFSEPLQIATVQFATQLSAEFSEEFLKALKDDTTPLEVRFALVRYFQRHVYPEARPFLLSCVKDTDFSAGELAVAACTALSRYPGEDTAAALSSALHSRNWYIRKNAAVSLASLGIARKELEHLQVSDDRYAREILEYAIQLQAQKEGTA